MTTAQVSQQTGYPVYHFVSNIFIGIIGRMVCIVASSVWLMIAGKSPDMSGRSLDE